MQDLAQIQGVRYDKVDSNSLVKTIIDSARSIQEKTPKSKKQPHSKYVEFKPSSIQIKSKHTSLRPSLLSKSVRLREKAENLLKRRLERQRKYLSAIKKPTIDEVVIDTGIKMDKLTSTTLKEWLKEVGLLNKKLFVDSDCVAVTQSNLGGSFTENLFFVYYYPRCDSTEQKKLIFIIKELKRSSAEKEVRNLNILQNSPLIRSLDRVKNPDLPQMTFSENFFQYQTMSGEKKYLLLIHAAKGNSFYDLMQEPKSEKTIEAFKKLGFVLGNFNKKFMEGKNCLLKGGEDLRSCTTISHGDMHPVNVFYDGKFVYFIDAETMAKSLKNRPLFITDALYFYAIPVYHWKRSLSAFKALYAHFEKAYLDTITTSPYIRKAILTQLMEPLTSSQKEGWAFINLEVSRLRI